MARGYDFSGIWHSVYDYTSSSKPGTFQSESDVKIQAVGNQVIIQSTPNDFGDYILIRLTQDDRILTGSWYEQTSPKGSYKGVGYYGAIQLILSEDGNEMRGKWVAFDRQMNVRSDNWVITRTTKKTAD
jgi:hypothetical protein